MPTSTGGISTCPGAEQMVLKLKVWELMLGPGRENPQPSWNKNSDTWSTKWYLVKFGQKNRPTKWSSLHPELFRSCRLLPLLRPLQRLAWEAPWSLQPLLVALVPSSGLGLWFDGCQPPKWWKRNTTICSKMLKHHFEKDDKRWVWFENGCFVQAPSHTSLDACQAICCAANDCPVNSACTSWGQLTPIRPIGSGWLLPESMTTCNLTCLFNFLGAFSAIYVCVRMIHDIKHGTGHPVPLAVKSSNPTQRRMSWARGWSRPQWKRNANIILGRNLIVSWRWK